MENKIEYLMFNQKERLNLSLKPLKKFIYIFQCYKLNTRVHLIKKRYLKILKNLNNKARVYKW